MAVAIRLAKDDDAEAVREVYAPFCRESPITFEVEPPAVEEMRLRIGTAYVQAKPWLVAEEDGRLMGFAHATRYRERAAYRWSVETSVYVAAGWRRCGVGRGLYTSLLAVLTLQGYVNAYAAITLPNDPSVGLHEAMGFRLVGTFRHVGYKADAWHDVGVWHLMLAAPEPEPREPRPLAEAQDILTWDSALLAGARLIRP